MTEQTYQPAPFADLLNNDVFEDGYFESEYYEDADEDLQDAQEDYSPMTFYTALKDALERLKHAPPQLI